MLKGYFDESGIHGGSPASPVCVVAGFVATTKACGRLSWNWQGLLRRYQLKYFHAKEYASRSGEFRCKQKQTRGWSAPGNPSPNTDGLRWDDSVRREFEIDAIAIINEAAESLIDGRLLIVGAAVNTTDFGALSVDHRRWLTGGIVSVAGRWKRQGAPSKPYFLAFQQVVLDATKFTQEKDSTGRHLGKGEPVHFVFDQQHEYESSAKALFNAMKQTDLSVKGRIGDLVFTSKERAVALQVGDFIAYESYWYLFNRIVRKEDELRASVSERLFRRYMRTVYIYRRYATGEAAYGSPDKAKHTLYASRPS